MRQTRAALCLLVLAAIVAVITPILEGRQRGPEHVARAYLQAVEYGDVDAALATLDPVQRANLRERVELQVRNRYEVTTLVIGRPSLLDRLTGREVAPAWVSVLAKVTTIGGERWQSSSTAPLVTRDGTLYLARPLFA